MSIRDAVLDIARADVGYAESPPGSNRTKFCDWYGVEGPWCAMYVSYAFYFGGLPLPIATPKGFSYCPDGLEWFRERGRLDMRPEVGALVFYHFQGGHEGANHVGVVEAFEGSVLTTLEGNTGGSDFDGGAVLRRERKLGPTVLGFGHPEFPDENASPGAPPFPGRSISLTSPHTRGEAVRLAQEKLRELGLLDGADGVFGPLTRYAVLAFQGRAGLVADGIVGPVTWRALFAG